MIAAAAGVSPSNTADIVKGSLVHGVHAASSVQAEKKVTNPDNR